MLNTPIKTCLCNRTSGLALDLFFFLVDSVSKHITIDISHTPIELYLFYRLNRTRFRAPTHALYTPFSLVSLFRVQPSQVTSLVVRANLWHRITRLRQE